MNYRQNHPEAAARNGQQQRQRDQKRRVGMLVKNTLVVDLKCSAAEVWLVGPPGAGSCKEHLGFFQASDFPVPAHGDSVSNSILKRTSSWSFVPAVFRSGVAMLSPEQINEIHRRHLIEKWSQRRIARDLRIGRHTLANYLDNPAPPPSRRDRASKLDTFKPTLAELLEKDPHGLLR